MDQAFIHSGITAVANNDSGIFYLIIHLKRFTQDGQKNNTCINFPLIDLDITNCVNSENTNNQYIYDLYAINHHSGTTMDFGHYWSSCKNLDGNWYNFNDADVSKYSNENLSQQLINDAYILFYQRKKIIRKPLQL